MADPAEEELKKARDRAIYRATFEMYEVGLFQCKLCGGFLEDDWDQAMEQHVDFHGPGPLEWWWTAVMALARLGLPRSLRFGLPNHIDVGAKQHEFDGRECED